MSTFAHRRYEPASSRKVIALQSTSAPLPRQMMECVVASVAERDQVLLGIIPKMAAKLLMVDF